MVATTANASTYRGFQMSHVFLHLCLYMTSKALVADEMPVVSIALISVYTFDFIIEANHTRATLFCERS